MHLVDAPHGYLVAAIAVNCDRRSARGSSRARLKEARPINIRYRDRFVRRDDLLFVCVEFNA